MPSKLAEHGKTSDRDSNRFFLFGSQRHHIQDIAVVPKKLNRTLVVIDLSPQKIRKQS